MVWTGVCPVPLILRARNHSSFARVCLDCFIKWILFWRTFPLNSFSSNVHYLLQQLPHIDWDYCFKVYFDNLHHLNCLQAREPVGLLLVALLYSLLLILDSLDWTADWLVLLIICLARSLNSILHWDSIDYYFREKAILSSISAVMSHSFAGLMMHFVYLALSECCSLLHYCCHLAAAWVAEWAAWCLSSISSNVHDALAGDSVPNTY